MDDEFQDSKSSYPGLILLIPECIFSSILNFLWAKHTLLSNFQLTLVSFVAADIDRSCGQLCATLQSCMSIGVFHSDF